MSSFAYRKITNLVLSNLCNTYIYVIYVSNVKERGNKNLITIIGADDKISDHIIKINLFFSGKDLEFIYGFKFGSILRFQRLKITQLHSNQKSYMGKGDLDDKGFNIINIPQNVTSNEIKTFIPISNVAQYSWEDSDKSIASKMKNDWSDQLKSYWEDYLLNQRGHSSIETGTDNKNKLIPTPTTNTISTAGTTTTTTTTTTNNNNNSNIKNITNINSNKKPKLSTEFTFTSIENLQANTFVSVAAKILDKSFPIGNGGKRANIKLWDGTGQDVIWDGDVPTLGNSIFANTWDQSLIDALDELPIGTWVAITGAKVGVYKDILELKLFKNSKVSRLPDDHGTVTAILSNYKKRIEDDEQLQQPSNEQGKSNENDGEENDDNDNGSNELIQSIKLTDTHYPHIPITNISDVLSENQNVPNKFKLNVSLFQHLPLNLQDFTRVFCKSCNKAAEYFDGENNHRDNDLISCSHCGSNLIEHIFLFKLILKDQTGTIPVIFSNHANYFLNMLPLNLYHNPSKLSMLESKMRFLKKKNATFDICIMSYYEVNKERVPENIKYQVFDTKLLV